LPLYKFCFYIRVSLAVIKLEISSWEILNSARIFSYSFTYISKL